MGKANEDHSHEPAQPANGEVPSSNADGEGCKQVSGEDVTVEVSKDDKEATQGSTPDESSNGTNAEMQIVGDTKVTADDPVPDDAALEEAPTVEQDANDSSLRESDKQEGAEDETVKEAVAAVAVGDATADTLENGADGKEQQTTDSCVDQQPAKKLQDLANGSVPGEACKSAPADSGNDASTEDSQPLTSTPGVTNTGGTETNGTAS